MTGSRALASDVTRRLREVRSARHPRGETFQTVYIGVFAVVLVTAMAGSLAHDALGASCAANTAAGAVHCVPPGARASLALAVAVGGWGALLTGLAAAGPVGADAARVSWLHSGLADRGVLLAPALALATVLGAAGGATAGALAALTAVGGSAAGLGAGTGAGGLVGVLTVAAVTLTQTGRSGAVERVATAGRALLAAAAALVLLGRAGLAPSVSLPAAGGSSSAVAVAAGAGAVLAVALVVAARAVLVRITSSELLRGAELTGAVRDSTLMLDPTAVLLVGSRRRAMRHGSFARVPGRGTGPTALLRRDLVRVRRQPGTLVGAAGGLAVVAVVGGMLGSSATVVLTALVALSVARPWGRGLAEWEHSTGLRRLLGVGRRTGRTALVVRPALLLLSWSALAATVALPWRSAPAVAACALVGLLVDAHPRRAAVTGPVVALPMGAVQPGLLLQLGGYLAAFVPAVVLARGGPGWGASVSFGLVAVLVSWGRD